MSKKYYKPPTHQTGLVVTTKTHFGTTGDMIVDHAQYKIVGTDNPISLEDNEVLCRDDRGFYVTQKNRVDTGLADPNRYANHGCRADCVELSENDSTG
jgi:hypothetical protein